MAESEESGQKRSASKQSRAEIDRIEDDKMAVLLIGDDGKTQLDVPLELLPEGACGGDHLRITISIDKGSRDEAAGRVKKLQDKLAESDGAGGQKDYKL
ncbi:MAG TPA: DUF3006 domain-containing protein [Pyrinomonadaceae bacterium]|nr:DUF3006 domain-containing protein [Pyrinomonadaceae bacterium]